MTVLYLLEISNLAFELIFEPKKEVPGPSDFLQGRGGFRPLRTPRPEGGTSPLWDPPSSTFLVPNAPKKHSFFFSTLPSMNQARNTSKSFPGTFDRVPKSGCVFKKGEASKGVIMEERVNGEMRKIFESGPNHVFSS